MQSSELLLIREAQGQCGKRDELDCKAPPCKMLDQLLYLEQEVPKDTVITRQHIECLNTILCPPADCFGNCSGHNDRKFLCQQLEKEMWR